MKDIVHRSWGVFWTLIRFLSLGTLGGFALAGFIALRHMLNTPQALESQLPGEGHLYRWNKGHLFYKVLGAPDAPPLVLLHSPGIAASAYEMRGIMEVLSLRFRVYAPDLPGFGLSDRPSLQYTFEFYTQTCREFLDKVVKQSAVLVASRLSCNYAVAVAASAPELCSGLVLISPLALRGQQKSRLIPSFVLKFGPVKSLLYPLLVLISRIPIRNDEQAAYYYATTHRFGAEHAVVALLAGELAQDVSHELEGVQQPTLVIWGAEALGTLPHTHFNQGVLPDSLGPKQARIELLPDGGLAIHEELPRKVAESILQWSENNALVASPVSTSSNIENSPSQPLRVEDAGAEQDSSVAMDSEEEASSVAEAYCVKCKTKRPMLNAREVTIKNGRFAVRGDCAVCGTQLFRMGRLPAGYPQTPV